METITDKTGQLDEILESMGQEALRWYEEMKYIIKKIINQIKNYNSAYEEADYWSEAFLAIQTGVIKYNKFRKYSVDFEDSEDVEIFNLLSRNPTMKFQTFAYWYLQKRLYKMADAGNVEFVITNSDGTEISITAEQYYKNRHKYNGNARSVKKVYNFSELAANGDREKEYEPIDYEDFIKIKRKKWEE